MSYGSRLQRHQHAGAREAMQPYSTEAVYVNYLDTDDAGRVRSAYGASTWRRLQLLKERYDP